MNPNGGFGPTPAIREAVLLDRFVFERYYRDAENAASIHVGVLI